MSEATARRYRTPLISCLLAALIAIPLVVLAQGGRGGGAPAGAPAAGAPPAAGGAAAAAPAQGRGARSTRLLRQVQEVVRRSTLRGPGFPSSLKTGLNGCLRIRLAPAFVGGRGGGGGGGGGGAAAAGAGAGRGGAAVPAAPADPCRVYGAGGSLRVPGRLNISWVDDNTLKVDMDAGTQTRLFHFNATVPPNTPKTLQGYSVATWEVGRGRWWRRREPRWGRRTGSGTVGKPQSSHNEPDGRIPVVQSGYL